MKYQSVISAVVRALAAEVMSDVSRCWEDPDAVPPRRGAEIVGKEEARLTDCWVNARLRTHLAPEQWRVLIAKYSTHVDRKHEAILAMTKTIKSPAPERFRNAAILTWAMPKLPGKDGKRSTNVLPSAWYCMDNWDNDGKPESTLRRWRSGIHRGLEDRVNEALVVAQEVLDAEGLLKAAA